MLTTQVIPEHWNQPVLVMLPKVANPQLAPSVPYAPSFTPRVGSILWATRYWRFAGHRVRGLLREVPVASSYFED